MPFEPIFDLYKPKINKMLFQKILKNLEHGFILVIILIVFSNCKNKNIQTISTESIIAGKIIDFNSSEHLRYIKFHFPEPIDDDLSIICDIDSNGCFKLKTERPYPQDYFLEYVCLNQLYTFPGDSLYVEIDPKILNDTSYKPKENKHIHIHGEHAPLNNEVLKYYRFFETKMINWEEHFMARE